MRLKDFDEALVLGAILINAFQFVARGAKCTGRGVAQCLDSLRAFLARVDQVLGERADDTVATGVELSNVLLVLAAGFNDAGRRGINDGSDAAGLSIKSIPRGFRGLRLRHRMAPQ